MIEINNSAENFDTWLSKDFVSKTRDRIINPSVLFVPTVGFREEGQPTFPVGTKELFDYFKENLPNDLVEICVDDELYKLLSLNSDSKRLGNFVITVVVAPLFVSVLSSYIYDNFVSKDDSKPVINYVQQDNSTHVTINNPKDSSIEKKQVREPAKKDHSLKRKYLASTNVNFTVTVVDTLRKKSVELKYDGPAKEVHTVTEAINNIIKNEQSPDQQ